MKTREDAEKRLMVDYTVLPMKRTTLVDGVHTTRGLKYELGKWTMDPNFSGVAEHDKSIHLAPTDDAFSDTLSSYGSHPMIMLPSDSFFSSPDFRSDQSELNRCFHDPKGVLPVLCLECDGLNDLSVLRDPQLWRDLGVLQPAWAGAPHGLDRMHPNLARQVWTGRAFVPE